MALPIIDLQSIPTTADLAAELMRVGSDPGFFYLTGHELDDAALRSIFHLAREFFEKVPMEEKRQFWDGSGDLGYTGLRDETLSGKGTGDLKESFYLSDVSDDTLAQPIPTLFQNHRSQIAQFFHRCQRLANHLLEAFAVGLNLEPSYLSSAHTGESCRMRFIHYPPVPSHTTTADSNTDKNNKHNNRQDDNSDKERPGAVEENDIRAGAHTDYGSITLLFREPDDQGGLQVLDHQSTRWIDVPTLPNAIVVNIGDALEFWTAGRLRSTVHRVAWPRSVGENVSRLSIPFFVQPDRHVLLEPLGGARGQGEMVREKEGGEGFKGDEEDLIDDRFRDVLRRKGYRSAKPITSHDHLMQRIQATYLNA